MRPHANGLSPETVLARLVVRNSIFFSDTNGWNTAKNPSRGITVGTQCQVHCKLGSHSAKTASNLIRTPRGVGHQFSDADALVMPCKANRDA